MTSPERPGVTRVPLASLINQSCLSGLTPESVTWVSRQGARSPGREAPSSGCLPALGCDWSLRRPCCQPGGWMPNPRGGPIPAGREEGCGQEELGHRRYHLRWAEGSRQAFPSPLFQARSAPLWGPSHGSVPRRQEESGRKGWAAHTLSESESVKTTVAETRSSPLTEVFHTQGRILPLPRRLGCSCSPSSALTAGGRWPTPAARAKGSPSKRRHGSNTNASGGYVIWDKSLNLSKPRFLYLQNGANDICFRGLS